ncbi:CoA transferase [uncultured Jatrophihabitans sp.]|uniref:CoA transferase n=1 Tax=uncultured Jatrophihabitans sp. TaxID=1610747 RepID=UPI0035CBFB92
MSAAELARRLHDDLTVPLAVRPRVLEVPATDESRLWALSGADRLTGYRDGPAPEVCGQAASATLAALAVAGAYLGAPLPGVEVLGERARTSGMQRNAPFSAGGAFRCLPARDGWFGLSLARAWDREVLPALTRSDPVTAPWDAVRSWLRDTAVQDALARAVDLQLPAAVVPPRPLPERRRPVEVTPGGPRKQSSRPTIVDLSALWAGPLCARLLRMAGARVVKVESSDRPDGARLGPPAFFRLMHAGHEFVQLDFRRQRAELHALVASADVVIEGSRPRALAGLGIDAHEHVASGTIWASVTAYGRQGADANRVGFGDDVAVGAGLLAWTGAGPVPAGDALADPLAGVHAAAAVAVALASERGSLLDVSMHDTARRAAAVT